MSTVNEQGGKGFQIPTRRGDRLCEGKKGPGGKQGGVDEGLPPMRRPAIMNRENYADGRQRQCDRERGMTEEHPGEGGDENGGGRQDEKPSIRRIRALLRLRRGRIAGEKSIGILEFVILPFGFGDRQSVCENEKKKGAAMKKDEAHVTGFPPGQPGPDHDAGGEEDRNRHLLGGEARIVANGKGELVKERGAEGNEVSQDADEQGSSEDPVCGSQIFGEKSEAEEGADQEDGKENGMVLRELVARRGLLMRGASSPTVVDPIQQVDGPYREKEGPLAWFERVRRRAGGTKKPAPAERDERGIEAEVRREEEEVPEEWFDERSGMGYATLAGCLLPIEPAFRDINKTC